MNPVLAPFSPEALGGSLLQTLETHMKTISLAQRRQEMTENGLEEASSFSLRLGVLARVE
jgi:hypothetical protein